MASSDSEKEEAAAAAAVAEEEEEEEDEHERAMEKQYWKYLPLQKAALTGDWEEAKRIIDGDGDALTAKITPDEEIALHVAVATSAVKLYARFIIKKKWSFLKCASAHHMPFIQKV
ncbi:unnamed protein product [Camellia sinensis]